MTKLERFLVQLTIFLIPTNLAYHWYGDWAYVNGRLVDYLLPKLYVSDLPILVLVGMTLYKRFTKHDLRFKIPGWTLALFIFLSLRSLFTIQPLPSIWMTLKWAEFGILGWYLISHFSRSHFLLTIRTPLWLSMIFQSFVGLYQFINQSSVSGYYFFGEVNLESAGLIYENYLGRLLVPPYGTTPHPNILAGFLLSGILLLVLANRKQNWRNFNFLTIIYYSSLGLFSLVLSLCLSFESFIALILIIFIISLRSSPLLLAIIFSTLILSPLFLSIIYHYSSLSDNPSIASRYELNQTAISFSIQHWLTGIGPNQFTRDLGLQSLQIGQKTFVYQPAHHIGLLLAAELGLVGLLAILIGATRHIKAALKAVPVIYSIPAAALILIGAFDHYPITLQAGQLLLTITLILPLLKRS